MRSLLVAFLLLAPLSQAAAHDHGRGGHLGVSLGLGFRFAPELVRVPGHAVFYAPGVSANLFFHDGLYWAFSNDRWYASARYDGPWDDVAPAYVPSVVLQVPVRYYRSPPGFFVGWHRDLAPRWDDHWGRGWDRHGGRDDGHRSHGSGRHGGRGDRDDRRDDDRRGGGHGRGGRD